MIKQKTKVTKKKITTKEAEDILQEKNNIEETIYPNIDDGV